MNKYVNFIKFHHKIDEIFEFEVFVSLAVWASIVLLILVGVILSV